MSRQIIQTETKGWTPAMRRNALIGAAVFAVLAVIVVFLLTHRHVVAA
jgi:hypothetical protein